jgi:CrcB protein
MNTLMVILGAAIGSPARFLVDQYFKKFTDKPAGTFIVNILGSFLIGLTFATTERWHDFLAVGFAGSFTTWSTFILDLYLGYELKRYKVVATNLIASLIFGLLAAYLGYNLVS